MKKIVGSVYNLSSHPENWPEIIGIYKLKCLSNGRIYIGKSRGMRGFRGRWTSHRSGLRNQRHENDHIQNAYNKYGESNFVFEIVEICDISKNLLERESYWIDFYDSMNNGFNIRDFVYNGEVLKERVYRPTPFELISPNGELVKGNDVNLFAAENNLNPSVLRAIMRGKNGIYSHKGYISSNPSLHKEEKEYAIISPEKKIYKCSTLKGLSDETGISVTSLSLLFFSGRTYHKGWHLPNLPEEKQKKVDHYIRTNSPFSVTLKSGEIISSPSLNLYCKENNLVANVFCKFLDGKMKSYLGLELATKEGEGLHCLKSPNGDLFYFDEVSRFCKENDIDYNSIRRVLNKKLRDYKGWTLKDTNLAATLKTPRHKPIQKIDPLSGKVLEIFDTLSAASVSLRGRIVSSVLGNISKCISENKSYPFYAGFYWRLGRNLLDFDKVDVSLFINPDLPPI